MRHIKAITGWYEKESLDRDILKRVHPGSGDADGYESGWNDCLDKIGGCRR